MDMSSEWVLFAWLFVIGLSLVTLLAGAFVGAVRARRLADWTMIGGMSLSVLGFGALLVLGFFFQPDWEAGPAARERFFNMMVMSLFAASGGFLCFAIGFLLFKLEARKKSHYLEGSHPAG